MEESRSPRLPKFLCLNDVVFEKSILVWSAQTEDLFVFQLRFHIQKVGKVKKHEKAEGATSQPADETKGISHRPLVSYRALWWTF